MKETILFSFNLEGINLKILISIELFILLSEVLTYINFVYRVKCIRKSVRLH